MASSWAWYSWRHGPSWVPRSVVSMSSGLTSSSAVMLEAGQDLMRLADHRSRVAFHQPRLSRLHQQSRILELQRVHRQMYYQQRMSRHLGRMMGEAIAEAKERNMEHIIANMLKDPTWPADLMMFSSRRQGKTWVNRMLARIPGVRILRPRDE